MVYGIRDIVMEMGPTGDSITYEANEVPLGKYTANIVYEVFYSVDNIRGYGTPDELNITAEDIDVISIKIHDATHRQAELGELVDISHDPRAKRMAEEMFWRKIADSPELYSEIERTLNAGSVPPPEAYAATRR